MFKYLIILFTIASFTNIKSQSWCMVDSSFEGEYQGSSINNEVLVFKNYNNELFVGGVFMLKNVFPETFFLAKWNGFVWSRIGNLQPNDGAIRCLEVYNDKLYAGGRCNAFEGNYDISKLACFDNGHWNVVGPEPFAYSATTTIYALKKYKNKLYVAGNGFIIGSTNYHHIASWNDTIFEQVGGGINPGYMATVYCMEVFNDELIVAGSFGYADTILTPSLAKWDGTKWMKFGEIGYDSIMPASKMTLDSINNVLYVLSYVGMLNNKQTFYIGKWDGVSWSYIPIPTQGLFSMYANNGDLYIGGPSYNNLETDTIIARWDGQQWHHIKGPNDYVSAITIYKDELYIGGGFRQVDSMEIYGIAKYGSSCITKRDELQAPNYKLRVFPNPSNDKFTINTSIPVGTVASLKVYSLNGILKKEIVLENENTTTSLDVSKWQKGTYTCSLIIDNKLVKSEKLVVN